MRRVAAVVLILLGTWCARGQSFDASQWEQGVTVLDAPWRLHFGDDPAFAQLDFDDSHWTLHRIDQDWASAGRKGYSGYVWYRMRVILPKSNGPLAIAIYPPAQAVEVYIDGTLAGTIGRMRPRPVWTFVRDVYAVPVPAALDGHSVEIALRVWLPSQTAPYAGEGAAAHPALLGTAGDDQSCTPVLELTASLQSRLLSSDPRVIHLHLAAQRLPGCVHHGPAKFVQHHPCGLVAGQTQLTLQEQGRDAALVDGHQVCRPEPMGQRYFGPMKDRPRGQRNLVTTLAALLATLAQQRIGFSMATSGTTESIWPTARC